MENPKAAKILDSALGLFARHGFKKVTMSDLAEAAEMSRPTLYAAFDSKEALLGALAARQSQTCTALVNAKLPKAKTLEARLKLILDVWVIDPFASIVDEPNGLDLIGNMALYAPKACDEIYAALEEQLAAALAPELHKKKGPRARDLAHILTLATKGLKASTATLAELRRMTDGLIAMAVATAASAG